MLLPLDHFSLQLTFAQKAAVLSKIPLQQALMEFTQYWARVNDAAYLRKNDLSWSFDPMTPDWQELCTRLHNGEPADEVAYDLYRRNDQQTDGDNDYFGCFRFDFMPAFEGNRDVIKIHFHNKDTSGYGPLSKERRGQRLQDLKNLFAAVQRDYPQAKVVQGGSWLYNIEAYKRLFPASFTTHMPVEKVPFPRTSGIWGQFLNSESEVKRDMAATFLTKVSQATTTDQLLQCFEYKILYPVGNIADCYEHFALI